MAIKVGDRLPDGTLMELGPTGPAPINVAEVTKGKKIAIFGIPGAFTPT
jgi:cytochrome c peroxidase